MSLHSPLWNDPCVKNILSMACGLRSEHLARKHHAQSLLRHHETQVQELRQEILEAERNIEAVNESHVVALREYLSQLPPLLNAPVI
jgi:hypothetical protein